MVFFLTLRHIKGLSSGSMYVCVCLMPGLPLQSMGRTKLVSQVNFLLQPSMTEKSDGKPLHFLEEGKERYGSSLLLCLMWPSMALEFKSSLIV